MNKSIRFKILPEDKVCPRDHTVNFGYHISNKTEVSLEIKGQACTSLIAISAVVDYVDDFIGPDTSFSWEFIPNNLCRENELILKIK